MPLYGVKSRDVNDLKFTWRSIRTAYMGVVFGFTCLHSLFTILHLYEGEIEFAKIGENFTIIVLII